MQQHQWITLRDVFRQEGLTERQIEDVFLLLSFKPERVQLSFYYVSIGTSHEYAASKVGVSRVHIGNYLRKDCSDIRQYLKQYVTV